MQLVSWLSVADMSLELGCVFYVSRQVFLQPVLEMFAEIKGVCFQHCVAVCADVASGQRQMPGGLCDAS